MMDGGAFRGVGDAIRLLFWLGSASAFAFAALLILLLVHLFTPISVPMFAGGLVIAALIGFVVGMRVFR